jgi:RNA polymerase sigma-70 factor (ECF subfamily)
LYKMYAPTIEDWCRRAGLSPEDSADVRQEVFRSVARGITTFRRDRPGDSFRGWLYATTRRRVVDYLRRAGSEPRAVGGTDAHARMAELPAEEPPGSEAAVADAREVYRRSILLIQAEFEERTWRAFWRVAVDGRRAGDVAAELGMTPGAVYIAKSRVLKRLREEFEELF